MEEKKVKFSFFQSAICGQRNELVYWVFQKGRILPVAIIQVFPGITGISIFKGRKSDFYAEKREEIKKSLEQFYGCS